MKQDMDLVKDILETAKAAAENAKVASGEAFVTDAISFQKVAYYIDIMKQEGFIKAFVKKGFSGSYVHASISSLTWKGNAFLSDITRDNIWSKVKHAITEKTGDVSLEVVKSLAAEIAKETFLH